MAAAKGYCFGWNVPVALVPTLEALAFRFPAESRAICPVLDARRKEVYAALFRREGDALARLTPDLAQGEGAENVENRNDLDRWLLSSLNALIRDFLERLAQEVEQQRWRCPAYCLMGNHYHLLLETPEPNLARGMRRLNGAYTQSFNRRHARVGVAAGYPLRGEGLSLVVPALSRAATW